MAEHQILTLMVQVQLLPPLFAAQAAGTMKTTLWKGETMVKVTANKGHVEVAEISGSGINVMSELCCIVDAVCTGWCSDEDEDIKDDMKRTMIKNVAEALLLRNLHD